MVSTDATEKPRSNGWIERTLLNCLANKDPEKLRSHAKGMQDVKGRLQDQAGNADTHLSDDESVYEGGRRAFHNLEEKGLVAEVEDANLSSDRYLVDAGYAPDDGRVTEWVLTDDGFEEIRLLDRLYEEEVANLRRRFGRPQ